MIHAARPLPRRIRPALVAAGGILWVGTLAHAAQLVAGPLPRTPDLPVAQAAFAAVFLAGAAMCALAGATRRSDRAAWVLFGGAMALGGIAPLIAVVFEPTVRAGVHGTEVLRLAAFPLAYLGLGLIILARGRHLAKSHWLDGAIAASATGAVGVTVILGPVLASTGGVGSVERLVFPLGDVALLAALGGALGLTGWKRQRDLWLLAGGLAIFAFADSAAFVREATALEGTSILLDFGRVAGGVAVAHSGLLRAGPQPREEDRLPAGVLVLPSLAALIATLLLLYGAMASVGTAALALAAASIVAAIVRTNLTFNEVRRLSISRTEARTDHLTGLPNRRMLHQLLAALSARGRPAAPGAGLLVLDLDHFKEVNDTLGHQAGDELLRAVGERLRAAVGGRGTLARLGGDEFAVVVPGPGDPEQIGRDLSASLAAPFRVLGLDVSVDASVGIALFPEHGRDADALLRHADVAMYAAKRGEPGPVLYAPDRDVHTVDRLTLFTSLRRGIEDGEMVLHYQPQICLRTGLVRSAEALVRWNHPTRGLLAPDLFVPFAERSTLIGALTESVLDQALAQLAAWRGRGTPATVSVNLSAADLRDERLAPRVARRLAEAGLPPDALRLEITETALMDDVQRAMRVTEALRAHGIAISLDDFGTGHSSLAYIKRLGLAELKIDRVFVREMRASQADAVIVRSTIRMAGELGLQVVAEGVEDSETLEQLMAYGCQAAQGYLFSRPVPAADLRWSLPGGAETVAAVNGAQARDTARPWSGPRSPSSVPASTR